MNKAEIISGLEDLVRDRKALLNNESSDDVFLHDIAVLNAAVVVTEKYVPRNPFLDMETLNLYKSLMGEFRDEKSNCD